MPLDGLQLGHYRLVRLIGSGGMSEVYLAEDTRINRQLAVKIVRTEADPYPDAHATNEATRLFQREMKAITTLDHPHILPLIDFGEEEVNKTALTYMVMPFRQEGSLADWLRQRGSFDILSPQDVAHFLLQAADALQHAHDHQLIHQDIKPSNFLIRSRTAHPNHPDLLLADFGIAKFTTATATASQSIRGTPAYMAPEQWDGQPVAATDQYALAIMAYQLLTGRPPFQGGPGQVMRQHFTVRPQPPGTLNPRIPPALDAVILRALAKNPADRFPSIAAFAQAFQAAVQGQGTDVPRSTPARTAASSSTIARNTPSGADIRATLAISKTESLTGTSRTLTLPGGRRVTIAVPAGTQHGQVIYLGGQGEPSSSGGPTGSLILTIAIQQAEEADFAPNIGNAEKTTRASNPNLQTPLIPVSDPYLPTALASNSSFQQPIVGYSPETSLHPPHTLNQGIPALPPISHGVITSRPLRSKGKVILLIGLALLMIASGFGLFYIIRTNQVTTASGNATAIAIAHNATTTAIAGATTTFVAENPDPYPPAGGTLALYDPLNGSSHSYNWYSASSGSSISCEFTRGGYHVNVSNTTYYSMCIAQATNFSNFAYEVQMTIIKGDSGGIVFRADSANSRFYRFDIKPDGSYLVTLYVDLTGSHAKTLISGSSSAIHTGLNQSNLIAVVANGSSITLYVNKQQVASVTNSAYSHGQIGVIAYDNSGDPTEVVFSNARVWTL